MSHIRPRVVSTEDPAALRREVWEFWLRDDLLLVLDYYAVEQRETRRHKWRVTACYSRHSIHGGIRCNLPNEEAPLPEAVKILALAQAQQRLRVTKWRDVK